MSFRFPFCLAALSLAVLAQDVRVTWVGQACFMVQDAGATVITDPPAASIGYALPSVSADVVTISHNHGDHNNSAGVRGEFTLVDGRPATARQEMTAARMAFLIVPAFHDNQQGAQRGPNALICWRQANLKFCHLGDLGQDELAETQLADLRNIDVLFVPAGGFFTIDAQRAAAFVAQLRPRVAILMHFRTALGGPAQLAAFPAAAEPFGEIRFKPASAVLSRGTLPAAPEVWLMEPAAPVAAVNAAGFTPGAPVAPGSLVSLFGEFTGFREERAAGFPLPRKLGDVEVMVGESAAPLLYVGPAQINFQAPRQMAPGQLALEVRAAGQRAARGSLTAVAAAPGLFAAVNQDGRLNSAANRARRGQALQIFATGQGELKEAVEDGTAAPLEPLAATPEPPEVLIGDRRAAVEFSGLAPGAAGLWQINAVIPSDAPAGAAVPLAVVLRGFRSNTISVAIE